MPSSKKSRAGDSGEAPAQSPAFEESLAQLEALVEELESGDLPLEKALAAFERGVTLTRQCQAALQAAEQKVEMLVSEDGDEKAVPFEPEQ
ncbi:MAG: exodeoxyribonuclease VII small subunit [Gammaproteobacteria bacterium]